VDVGARFPKRVYDGDQDQDDENTKHNVIGVLVEKVLLLLGPLGLGLASPLTSLWVGL
jgi:hypothetical protein